MASRFWGVLEAIGEIVVPYWLIHQVDNVLNFFRTSHLYRFRHAGKENWAFVTGASDGIGEALAHELAERGFNVILHGRNPEKLKKKEDILRAAYPNVKTKTWIADCTEEVSRESIIKAVDGVHLTLLINNAGGIPPGHDVYSVLEDQPFTHMDRTMQMNAGFPTKMESALLPILMENQPSGIVNISSLGAKGVPFVSVYSGAKGYLNAHSMSLQCELTGRKKDVTVHSMLVGKVISNSLASTVGFATPTSNTMARAILDNIGLGGCIMTPYLPHLIQSKLIGMFPESIARKLTWDAMAAAMDTAEKAKKK